MQMVYNYHLSAAGIILNSLLLYKVPKDDQ